MCGLCGKKSDELQDEVNYVFQEIQGTEPSEDNDISKVVMICKLCEHSTLKSEDDEYTIKTRRYHFPYGFFEDYSYDNMLEEAKENVNYCINAVKSAEKYKPALDFVRDTMQNIKSLKLEKEHRDELYDDLKTVADELNEKLSNVKDQIESEYNEKYEKLKALVEEALKYTEETKDYKEARERLIIAQNEMKNINLKRQHRDDIFADLNKAFEDLNTKQIEERESYEMECIENYHNIKASVQEAVTFVKSTEDLREARKTLIDAQSKFKGLRLKKEQREEQYSLIQEAFEDLNKRQDEEREAYEAECNSNYEQLKPIIDSAVAFAAEVTFFKEGRERLISAQREIKDKKLRKEQRDELYSTIRTSFEELNKRQDEERAAFEKESSENFADLKPKVDEAIAFSKEATYFKEAREKLISAQNEIKDKRLKRSQKDSLFQAIRTAFEELNKRQDEERAVYEQECADNYKILKENVDSAITFADNSDDYGQARERLISSQNTIKGMKLKRDQRDELYAAIRTCFEALNERNEAARAEFEKESEENFNRLIAKVEEAGHTAKEMTDFRNIRENLIALQNEIKILKLRRKHRNELFDKIREVFNIFDERQESRRDIIKQEKQEKLVLILSNLKEKKARLQESIERDNEALNEQMQKLENLNPDNNEIAIDNTHDKMKSIRARIKDKEENMEQINSRMTEIKEELKS